jgi:5'-nucleotidase
VRDAGAGTDFHAVENDFVSVTPLDIDLTGRAQIDATRSWVESV